MKKKNFLAVSAMVALLAVSTACQREPDPRETVKNGVSKLAKTVQSSFEWNVKGAGKQDGQPYAFQVNATGKGDSGDKENQKVDAGVRGNFSSGPQKGQIGLDMRFLDSHLYVRLGQFDLEQSIIPKNVIAQFSGKWWDIPAKDDGDQKSYVQGLLGQKEKILVALKETELFENIQKVSEEEVKGELSRKYQVDVSRSGMQKIMEAASAASAERDLTEGEKNSIADYLKLVEFTGNVWVGKTSGTLNRLVGTIRLTDKDGTFLSFDMDGTFFDFNKELSFEKPSDASPFDPALLFGVVGSLITPPPAPALVETPAGTPIDQPLGAKQVQKNGTVVAPPAVAKPAEKPVKTK